MRIASPAPAAAQPCKPPAPGALRLSGPRRLLLAELARAARTSAPAESAAWLELAARDRKSAAALAQMGLVQIQDDGAGSGGLRARLADTDYARAAVRAVLPRGTRLDDVLRDLSAASAQVAQAAAGAGALEPALAARLQRAVQRLCEHLGGPF